MTVTDATARGFHYASKGFASKSIESKSLLLMLSKIRYFLFLMAVLVVIVVAFQNHHAVDIEILTFSGRYPLTLLLLSTSVVSFILGSIITVWRSRKRERTKARQQSLQQTSAKQAKTSSAGTPSAASADSSGSARSSDVSPLET